MKTNMIEAILSECENKYLAKALSLLNDDQLIPILRIACNDYFVFDEHTFTNEDILNQVIDKVLYNEYDREMKLKDRSIIYDNFKQEAKIGAHEIIEDYEKSNMPKVDYIRVNIKYSDLLKLYNKTYENQKENHE